MLRASCGGRQTAGPRFEATRKCDLLNKDRLEGNTRFLATLLLETVSMFRWTHAFVLRTEAEIADGVIDGVEQLKLFQDHIVEAKPGGFLGPIDLDEVDWKALLDYCKSKLDISEQAVRWERVLAHSIYDQLPEGSRPKALREALSATELESFARELREREFDSTFRAHRIDELMAFIDWLDSSQGPFDAPEVPEILRRNLRARSGTYLARIWLQTFPLRYPEGVPWRIDKAQQ